MVISELKKIYLITLLMTLTMIFMHIEEYEIFSLVEMTVKCLFCIYNLAACMVFKTDDLDK